MNDSNYNVIIPDSNTDSEYNDSEHSKVWDKYLDSYYNYNDNECNLLSFIPV